jgi:rubredoxin
MVDWHVSLMKYQTMTSYQTRKTVPHTVQDTLAVTVSVAALAMREVDMEVCCPACYKKDMSGDLVNMIRHDQKATWVCPKCGTRLNILQYKVNVRKPEEPK